MKWLILAADVIGFLAFAAVVAIAVWTIRGMGGGG